MDYERQGLPEAVLDLCSDQVRWHVPGRDPVVGHTRVREYLRHHPAPPILALEAPILSLAVVGSLAVKLARFRTRVVAEDPSCAMTYQGRHLWVLRRGAAGSPWKVAEISWEVQTGQPALGPR